MDDLYDDEGDGYDDDHYNHDNNDQHDDPYKFYFTFNIDNTSLSEWVSKMINDMIQNPESYDNYKITNIPGFPMYVLPVNSWNPITGKNNSFQYLGSNYYEEPIYKTKYLISNTINQQYKLHLQNNAKHFISQPSYYKGLFDILN